MAKPDLHSPIKRFVERQGYAAKGEVHDCDIVAVRGDEAPVTADLLTHLNLALLLQSVDRLITCPAPAS